MFAQFYGSVLVGLAVSAALFAPLLVWQYRRYGRFDGLRMLWTSAGFIYATAVIAFTVFPLPAFTQGFCAEHRTHPLLDPLRFPRGLLQLVQTRGAGAIFGDWLLWEFTLNMVLFIPFGVIVRRLLEWPRVMVIVSALTTSVFIEVTQGTGNWGLAPCPYRFADVTDLFTNTAGAFIGVALESVTPRLLSTKEHLIAQRDKARPVSSARRVRGMLLDAWYLLVGTLLGGTAAAVVHVVAIGGPDHIKTQAQIAAVESSMALGAWLATLAAIIVPSLTGDGASLGQRTLYLAPVSADRTRRSLVLRAIAVQGILVTGLLRGFPPGLLVLIWAATDVAWALINPRGLSCALTRCTLRDSRDPDDPSPLPVSMHSSTE